jgi:hypothetical protein
MSSNIHWIGVNLLWLSNTSLWYEIAKVQWFIFDFNISHICVILQNVWSILRVLFQNQTETHLNEYEFHNTVNWWFFILFKLYNNQIMIRNPVKWLAKHKDMCQEVSYQLWCSIRVQIGASPFPYGWWISLISKHF